MKLSCRLILFCLHIGLFVRMDSCFGSETGRIEEDTLKLLTYYNQSQNRLPTEKGKRPTVVSVGFLITDLKMDVNKMQTSLVLDLLQEWEDSRLNYSSLTDASDLGGNTLWEEPYIIMRDDWMRYIWKPDTFIPNSVSGSVFNYPMPNRAARLYSNGTIRWIQRLSGVFPCSVDRLKFPMDTHVCPVKLKSFDHSVDKMKLQWLGRDQPVMFEDDFIVSEPSTEFEKTTFADCTKTSYDGEVLSCIEAKLNVKKSHNIYVLQVYFPSTLTVILSWLNFWIDREVIQARVSLGSLCVVTIMTHATGLPYILPEESVIKAIDVWEVMCIALVFAGMLEFALMHTMLMRRKKMKMAVEMEEKAKKDVQETDRDAMIPENFHCEDEKKKLRDILREKWWHCDPSRIDIIARRLFPVVFIIFNIVYWITYRYT